VTDRSRRRWLASVGAASLAVGLPRCDRDEPVVAVDAGPIEEWTRVRWRLFEGAKIIVARDGRGLFAMTAVCPHQGCIVGPTPGRVCVPPEDGATSETPTLCCACHSSFFDGDGLAISGPAAPRSLAHWRVLVEGGRVRVMVNDPVAVASRALG
jgi:nitrite reductase/ring-hydroxylating ferredoxin subunit